MELNDMILKGKYRVLCQDIIIQVSLDKIIT